MKNKFNIGDKVKIREDLVEGRAYGKIHFLHGYMSSCKGQIFTVEEITQNGHYSGSETPFYWSEEMLVRYNADKVIFNGNATVLIKDGKKYVSKCKDGDTYDKEKGLLLCLAQANGISYRDLQEMIAGAKDCNAEKVQEFAGKIATGLVEAVKAFKKAFNGEKADDKAQVREVTRNAKVGEYIKIVHGVCTGDCYKDGEIFKVIENDDSCGGVYIKTDKTHPCCAVGREGQSYVSRREYVVLENYKPYKITLSEFLKQGAKIAVNLKTDEEYTAFVKACHKLGHFEGWKEDGENRSYAEDYCLSRYLGYGYCHKKWYEEEGCTVYNFDEVDLEN